MDPLHESLLRMTVAMRVLVTDVEQIARVAATIAEVRSKSGAANPDRMMVELTNTFLSYAEMLRDTARGWAKTAGNKVELELPSAAATYEEVVEESKDEAGRILERVIKEAE